MKAISIIGYKKTGKTTLAVNLAREFVSRGLKVAAAKFTHHGFDREKTDTALLAEVCSAVVGLSENQTQIIWNSPRFLPDLLPLVSADVLIVEGGKSLGWLPRVLLLRSPGEADELGRELALATFGQVGAPGLHSVTNVSELAELVLAKGFALPGLDCGSCGLETCWRMAERMVAGTVNGEDKPCKAAHGALRIEVGGARLAMNPFVASIVRGAIVGMLGQLKGYAPGAPVRIEMD